MKVLIMAGGRGARFWPRSQPDEPKQCIRWGKTPSLLLQAVQRAALLCSLENIFILTGPSMEKAIRKDLSELSFPAGNVLIEPSPRNTAPCIALAIGLITPAEISESVLIMPADHLIQDNQAWIKCVLSALSHQQGSGETILFGIQPTSPHTGYGYIEAKEKINPNNVAPVNRFIEKPNLSTAESLLQEGNYLWNAGMILARIDKLEAAFKEFLPGCDQYIQSLRHGAPVSGLWFETESISLDYGILENLDGLQVIAMQVGWSDLGAWDAAHLVLPQTSYGHGSGPFVVGINSNNCIVLTDNLEVALVGVDNIAVVQHGTQLLVLNLDDAQSIRYAVTQMESPR